MVLMKISQTVVNLQSRHEYMVKMAMFNVQRVITLEVDKSELWFMCSERRLMVLCTCVRFCKNIMNGISVMERTQVHGRNGYFQYL